MKNSKLQDFTSNELKISNSQKMCSTSRTRKKCYKLFFSCFKIDHEEESQENSLNGKLQEYDYLVEKLLVKRIPFLPFELPKNTLEYDVNKETEKLLTTVEGSTMFSNDSKAQSIIYYCDKLNQNIPMTFPNKHLYFDTDINTLYEGNKTMLTVDGHTKMKEIMNTLSCLDPDLKEYEKLPCDQCFLSIPKNKTIFNPNSLNAKDNAQEHIKLLVNTELQHNWKTSVNKSKAMTKKTGSIDLSNITLRWKVILKHYKCKTP